MLRRLLKVIILIPLAGVLVGWAVANRRPVMVSFNPFDPADPTYAVMVPLYRLGFAVLLVGVVLGGTATWFTQGKWRRARARLAAEVSVVRTELERHKRDAAARDNRALAPSPGAVAKRPPAA
jgi:hypothetical protein